MDCTCHTTPHYDIYLYVVPHLDLRMEDGWLCLTYYTIYYHAFPGSPHGGRGWTGSIILLLYHILSCLRHPFVVPRWSTCLYKDIMHSCRYSNKSHSSWTLHGAGMNCRLCIATSCLLLMTFHGAWMGCVSLHSELKLLHTPRSCTLNLCSLNKW